MRKFHLQFIRTAAMLLSSFFITTAYAAEAPAPGLERIGWAIECSGKMPKTMLTALILLAFTVFTTIILHVGGGKRK